jgi:hypothetical protein
MTLKSSDIGQGDLERVRAWAQAKLATGEEPPWAWYQYMKLRETLDAILGGMEAVKPQMENSPREAQRPERHLRLVGAMSSPDNAQPHQSDEPVPLPM